MTPTIPFPEAASDLNLLMTEKSLLNEVAEIPDGPWLEDELEVVDVPPHATSIVPRARRRPAPPTRLSPTIFLLLPECGDLHPGPSPRWGRAGAGRLTRMRSRS